MPRTPLDRAFRFRNRLQRSNLFCLVLPSFAALSVSVPGGASAGGYYVPEQGSRAMAMGGAVTAFNPRASTLMHNPAALAHVRGTQAQLSTLGVMMNIDHWRRPVDQADGSTKYFDKTSNTNRLGAVPSFFASSDFGVKNLSVGIGAYVPFGADLKYPTQGSQRYVVTETSLRNYYVTPTVSYKLDNGLSFGVGLSYIYSTFMLRQANSVMLGLDEPENQPVPDPELDGTNALVGKDAASFGANLGLMFQDPKGRFSVGISAMLPTQIDFEGQVFMTSEGFLGPESFDGELKDTLKKGEREDNFRVSFKNPLILRAGFMVHPIDPLWLTLDANWQRWSTSESLTIDFENNWPMIPVDGRMVHDVENPLHWKDTLTLRMGAEGKPSDKLPLFLRMGALYDQSPVSDAYFDLLVPDSDKFGVSAGVGYTVTVSKRAALSFDLAYQHLRLRQRNIAPVQVGTPVNAGNDDNEVRFDDSADNDSSVDMPGSYKTILNKPAPSFFYGVTQGFANLLGLSIALRL